MQPGTDELFREALALLETIDAKPPAHSDVALVAFRRRSAAHADALERAERYLASIQTLPDRTLTRRERGQLKRQLLLARFGQQRAPLMLGVVLLIGLSINLLNTDDSDALLPVAEAVIAQEYQSPGRASRSLRLRDGSTLWLDWGTRVTVVLSKRERRVQLLQGRAAFKVTTDRTRPFFVEAEGIVTRVTGTEFIVGLKQTGTEVEVLEGSVSVSDGEGVELSLAAGDSAISTAGVLRADRTDPEEMGTWREGLIVVRDRPLEETLQLLEPYSRYHLDLSMVDSDALVSASFFIERADDAVLALAQTHDLTYRLDPPNTLVLLPAPLARPEFD